MCIAKQNLVFLEQNFLNCRGKGERVHTYAEGVRMPVWNLSL